jgi:hypothetical protein
VAANKRLLLLDLGHNDLIALAQLTPSRHAWHFFLRHSICAPMASACSRSSVLFIHMASSTSSSTIPSVEPGFVDIVWLAKRLRHRGASNAARWYIGLCLFQQEWHRNRDFHNTRRGISRHRFCWGSIRRHSPPEPRWHGRARHQRRREAGHAARSGRSQTTTRPAASIDKANAPCKFCRW